MSEINNTLNERGERYGNYSDVAGTTQQLMAIVECGANYEHLNAEQKDPETGEHHLAHAICCGMFLWWFDDMGDDSHIENHISPLCKMGVR